MANAMRTVAMVLMLAVSGGCDRDEWWFLPYDEDVEAVDFASNASFVQLSGYLDLERDGAYWSCDVSPSDRVILDGTLTYLESLTSEIYGDVTVGDPRCDLDPNDFDGDRHVNASLEVSYDLYNLPYGEGSVQFTLDVMLQRSDDSGGFVSVSDPLVCVDGRCGS